jgi:hypothetical protein
VTMLINVAMDLENVLNEKFLLNFRGVKLNRSTFKVQFVQHSKHTAVPF